MRSLEYTSVAQSKDEEADDDEYDTGVVIIQSRRRGIVDIVGSLCRDHSRIVKWVMLLSVLATIVAVRFRVVRHGRSGQNSSSSKAAQREGSPADTDETPQDSSAFCESNFQCRTDRLGHNVKLNAGQALCKHELRFGLFPNGTFALYNCTEARGSVIYAPQEAKDESNFYFVMDETATFQIRDGSKVLWTKQSNRNIQPSPKCLDNPELDCPYLHLHRDAVVVLNWINKDDKWEEHNIRKCYDELFLL